MIVSFYSYKGGVGRSQLCANIAAYLFYHKCKRVLLWDWDFEAPGLHYFFGLKNKDITKKGTLEIFEDYMVTMRSNAQVKSHDLPFITEDNIISLVDSSQSEKKLGCIDLLAAGIYENEFSWRSSNFDWFEFYNMMDGATYIEQIKGQLSNLKYDYILVDSRTGISDYSGICNIQLPDVNVIVIAPTMQNFEGSKAILEKIENAEYLKLKKRKPKILPVLSRLDYSNSRYNEWVGRFGSYFNHIIKNLDDNFDYEFLQEIFSDVYFKDTFIAYTPAISAGENILFSENKRHTVVDFSRPFINIAEFLESLQNTGSINFYKRMNEDTWQEYASKAEYNSNKRKAAIAYTQIGIKQTEADKKIEYYNQSIRLDPQYYLPYFYAGNNYLIKGNRDKAIEYFLKSIELNPDFEKAYFNLGLAYDSKGEADKAIGCYTKAVEINPDYVDGFYALGLSYNKSGNFSKAIEYYQKTIQLDPKYEEVYYMLGLMHNETGEVDKAIAYFQKAILIKPDYDKAINNLGVITGSIGDIDKAIQYFEKAIKIKPDYQDSFYNLGLAYRSKGKTDEAISYFLKANELKADNENVLYNLALAYENKGESDMALKYYKKVEELKASQKSIESKSDFVTAFYNINVDSE